MKHILFSAMAGGVAFCVSAADGTFIGSNVIAGVREYVLDSDGTKLLKANGAVQFIYNGAILGAGTYGFVADGIFSVGTISIPNEAGNTVALTIEVWDKSTGVTFETATMDFRETLTITLGGAGIPPAPAAPLTGFKYGVPVPELSTITLSSLGLGSLLFVSRRRCR